MVAKKQSKIADLLGKIRKIKQMFYISKQDLVFLSVLVAIFSFADLFTKWLVFSQEYSFYRVNDLLNFIKVRNYGISFGMFDDRTTGMKMFIILFDILVMIYLMTLVKTQNEYKKPNVFKVSIALIFGGAVGNLIDRVMFGFVRDFIDCHIADYHWATFNVADICVCVGVGLWILCEFCYKNKVIYNSKTKIRTKRWIKK